MAKRIKIKGKPPRGLSKATRQIDAAQESLDRSGVHMSVRSPKKSDAELAKMAGLGRGITKPSSTRKKRVKEGSPKFIGPRTRESIMREAFDEGSRQFPKVRMAEDDSQPIGQNDEIYRRLGEMLLRKLGSRPV